MHDFRFLDRRFENAPPNWQSARQNHVFPYNFVQKNVFSSPEIISYLRTDIKEGSIVCIENADQSSKCIGVVVGKRYRDFAKHWKVQHFEWDPSDGGQLIARWFLCKASEDWLKKNLANNIFGYLARCEKIFGI